MLKEKIFNTKLLQLQLQITLKQKESAKKVYKECFSYFQNNKELGTELYQKLDELKDKINNL